MTEEQRNEDIPAAGTPDLAVTEKHIGRRAFLGLMAAGSGALWLGPEIYSRVAPSSLRSALFPINSVAMAPTFDPASWRFRVDGLVGHPLDLSFAEFTALPQMTETKDFTCVTGWTVPGVSWKGVRLRELMSRVNIDPRATHLIFRSGDVIYSDSLAIAEAPGPAVLLAHEMNGAPLSLDHGQPLRLVVPGSYGYKSVKWMVGIEFINAPQGYPGYWELNGYASHAEIP
jgi:methionine sulfoxide reductase catalytic subunit